MNNKTSSDRTIAQNIAADFHDDGLHTTTLVLERCDKEAADRDQDWNVGSTRFIFADDSAIVVTDDGWDLGFTDCDCHCWQGAGHSDNCPEGEDL